MRGRCFSDGHVYSGMSCDLKNLLYTYMSQCCKSLIPHDWQDYSFRYKYIILLLLNLHNCISTLFYYSEISTMNPTFLQGFPWPFTFDSSICLYIHFSYFLFLYTLFTSLCPVAPFFLLDPTNYFLDYPGTVFFRYPQGFHMA